jgi:hypothetical protein
MSESELLYRGAARAYEVYSKGTTTIPADIGVFFGIPDAASKTVELLTPRSYWGLAVAKLAIAPDGGLTYTVRRPRGSLGQGAPCAGAGAGAPGERAAAAARPGRFRPAHCNLCSRGVALFAFLPPRRPRARWLSSLMS